jgi:predicted RNA methylase
MQSTVDDMQTPHRVRHADVVPVRDHVPMLVDDHRMEAFQQAINTVVKPDMYVLDLGAGSGVLSFFAAQQGARVTAVEHEPVVFAAARSALQDIGTHKVDMVLADARTYTPSEPVDVVICEMMHVGQLREHQMQVLREFKENYLAAFDGGLPRFLPEACVMAAQPVQQDFTFHGYAVALPQFQDPFTPQARSVELADPLVYQQFFYDGPIPERCTADLSFRIGRPGWLNAVRIITKNVLAGELSPPSSVDWLMDYLVVPLPEPVYAHESDRVRITFDYRPGDEVHILAGSIRSRLTPAAS